MELTREDLISILKNRISDKFDLRKNNPFATYYDQYGRLEWKEEYFNRIPDDGLESHISVIEKMPKID